MSVRKDFEKKFGKEDADALVAAATSHENGMHPNQGKDPFKWALMLAISYECFTKPAYRKYHGIKASGKAIKQWVKEHGHLESYDGDTDTLALFAGTYNEYMPKKAKS